MNYLQLCQEVHLILRIGEETPGTQPTQVTNQQGVLAEMVQWVNKAHRAIALDQPWNFMRGSANFTLTTGTRVLTLAAQQTAYPTLRSLVPFVTNEGQYVGITPTAQPGAAEMVCEYVPYQQWQGTYDAPPLSTGTPTYFTIAPDGSLEFNAIPDQDYAIRVNFLKRVVDMVANTDLPMFPEEYHPAIVWWAIVHYYCPSRDKTVELRQKAEIELKREMRKLYNDELPDFTFA